MNPRFKKNKTIYLGSFFLLFLFIVMAASTAKAAPPTLFFSDLDSGPKTGWENGSEKGAAVTVWGMNFGAPGSSSKVTVAGQDIASTDTQFIAEWNTAAIARGMRQITFWLKPTSSDGAGTITVTTAEGKSNSIPFTVRAGNIYYATTTGNNSNDGKTTATAFASALATLSSGTHPMSPGDILYLRQGIYPQANNSPNQNIRFDNEAGTAGSPIAYVSYPTEVATIGDGTCGIGFGQYSNPSAGHGFSHHITIAKLKFNNSVGGIGSGQNPVWNDFRFIANDIQHGHGNGWAGAIFFAHYYNIKVLGNYVNDMGYNKYDHTIYLNSSDSTGDSYNIEVAWNELTNQQGGSNIKCNPVESGATAATTDVFIHDNYIHDSPNEAIQLGSRLGNIQIWNNLIYHTGYSAGGYPGGLHTTISISNNPYTPMVKFFNNTLVDTASGASCLNFAGYGNMYLDNNIYSEPVSGRTFYIGTDFGGFLGTFVEVTNNLYNNFTAPGWETHSLMGSPSFMSNTDFHLHSGSIAIDAGANTSAVVSQDYDGNPRPRYKGFDIGAFEYTVFKPLILQ